MDMNTTKMQRHIGAKCLSQDRTVIYIKDMKLYNEITGNEGSGKP